MIRVLHRGNTQVIETTSESLGTLKYKAEFKTPPKARRPASERKIPAKTLPQSDK